jgi:hypothetical protein
MRPRKTHPCLQQTITYWSTRPPTYSAFHPTRFAIGAATAKSPSTDTRSTTIGSSVGLNWSKSARSSTRPPGEDRSPVDHVHRLPKPVLGTCFDAQKCVGQRPQFVAVHCEREGGPQSAPGRRRPVRVSLAACETSHPRRRSRTWQNHRGRHCAGPAMGRTPPPHSARSPGIIALEPQRVICLDAAYGGNDQQKTNTVLEMNSHGIEFRTV